MKPQRHPSPRKSRAPIPGHASAAPQSDEPEANTPNSPVHAHIPEEWSWHYRMLLHLRERLVRASAEHATKAAVPPQTLGGEVDAAQEQADCELLWTKLGNETDRLFEVDCALQRMRDGTFGFCEETGHPIPAERLRAVPWTRYALAATPPIEQRPVNGGKTPERAKPDSAV